jgi:hypothetical protein
MHMISGVEAYRAFLALDGRTVRLASCVIVRTSFVFPDCDYSRLDELTVIIIRYGYKRALIPLSSFLPIDLLQFCLLTSAHTRESQRLHIQRLAAGAQVIGVATASPKVLGMAPRGYNGVCSFRCQEDRAANEFAHTWRSHLRELRSLEEGGASGMTKALPTTTIKMNGSGELAREREPLLSSSSLQTSSGGSGNYGSMCSSGDDDLGVQASSLVSVERYFGCMSLVGQPMLPGLPVAPCGSPTCRPFVDQAEYERLDGQSKLAGSYTSPRKFAIKSLTLRQPPQAKISALRSCSPRHKRSSWPEPRWGALRSLPLWLKGLLLLGCLLFVYLAYLTQCDQYQRHGCVWRVSPKL